MRKSKGLLWLILLFFVAVAFPGNVHAQGVTLKIDVVSGSIRQETLFSEHSITNNDVHIKDSYQSNFRAHQADLSFSKTFGPEGVNTKVKGVSGMYISGKEVGSVETVAGSNGMYCCGAAAGSQYTMKAMEYESDFSPGGVGSCCGVNFGVISPQGDGRIEVASIYRVMDETTYESAAEGTDDPTTDTVYTNSYHKDSVVLNGLYNGLNVNVDAKVCTASLPDQPFFDPFVLCADEQPTLNPWTP